MKNKRNSYLSIQSNVLVDLVCNLNRNHIKSTLTLTATLNTIHLSGWILLEEISFKSYLNNTKMRSTLSTIIYRIIVERVGCSREWYDLPLFECCVRNLDRWFQSCLNLHLHSHFFGLNLFSLSKDIESSLLMSFLGLRNYVGLNKFLIYRINKGCITHILSYLCIIGCNLNQVGFIYPYLFILFWI